MNKSKCTNGEQVSEATISARLSKAYREFYLFEPKGACEGCGNQAQCTAHIVPKARCKVLGISEMIWNPYNWFRSCYTCNTICENPESQLIKELMNYDTVLAVTKKLDNERYLKMTL